MQIAAASLRASSSSSHPRGRARARQCRGLLAPGRPCAEAAQTTYLSLFTRARQQRRVAQWVGRQGKEQSTPTRYKVEAPCPPSCRARGRGGGTSVIHLERDLQSAASTRRQGRCCLACCCCSSHAKFRRAAPRRRAFDGGTGWRSSRVAQTRDESPTPTLFTSLSAHNNNNSHHVMAPPAAVLSVLPAQCLPAQPAVAAGGGGGGTRPCACILLFVSHGQASSVRRPRTQCQPEPQEPERARRRAGGARARRRGVCARRALTQRAREREVEEEVEERSARGARPASRACERALSHSLAGGAVARRPRKEGGRAAG